MELDKCSAMVLQIITEDMKGFGLFLEDAQDWHKWRSKVKGITGQPSFMWKIAIKVIYVCVLMLKH